MTQSFKFLITLAILAIAMSPVTQAENIPPHLSAMAAQLYKAVEEELSTGSRDKQHKKILEESVNFLKKLSVHRWSRTPPIIDRGSITVAKKLELDLSVEKDRDRLNEFIKQKAKDGTDKALHDFNNNLSNKELNILVSEIDKTINDAMEKVSTTHLIEGGSGHSLLMQWKPEAGRFAMKVSNDSKDGGDEFATLLSSDIATSVGNGGKESLTIQSSTSQIQIFTASDIEEMRGNILGKWTDKETGEVYTFTTAYVEDGEIIPSRESFDKKINQHKEKIKAIKDDKIYEWKNKDTKEIIKQSKFRSLKEPFEWVGEKYAMDNAQAEISKLEQQISDLIKERDGGNLSPRDKQDPGGFNEVSNSKDARPITVRVKRLDGYSYTYDDGVFDGMRIRAKRTYRDIRDIGNLEIPETIRRAAISDGWDPPGWLELDATIDAENGKMVLGGNKWALHITWGADAMFGPGSPVIYGVHTPYPDRRNLYKNSHELIRVVRREGDQYFPVGDHLRFYGESLFLEARYKTIQEEFVKTAKIEWKFGDGPELRRIEILLTRTEEDPLVYRSEAFYVVPSPIPERWLDPGNRFDEKALPDIEL